MIVDTIIGLFTTVLGAIFDVLPTFDIVSALSLPSAGSHASDSGGTIAGQYMGGFNGILPLEELFTMVYVAFAAMLAFYAIYKLANWIWRHIPELWGFGPGSG